MKEVDAQWKVYTAQEIRRPAVQGEESLVAVRLSLWISNFLTLHRVTPSILATRVFIDAK